MQYVAVMPAEGPTYHNGRNLKRYYQIIYLDYVDLQSIRAKALPTIYQYLDYVQHEQS